MHSQTCPSNTWECCHQGNIIQQQDEVKGQQQRSGNSGCQGWHGVFGYWTNYLDLLDTMNGIDSDRCRTSSNSSLFAILIRQSPFLSFLHTYLFKKSLVYGSNRIMSHLFHTIVLQVQVNTYTARFYFPLFNAVHWKQNLDLIQMTFSLIILPLISKNHKNIKITKIYSQIYLNLNEIYWKNNTIHFKCKMLATNWNT